MPVAPPQCDAARLLALVRAGDDSAVAQICHCYGERLLAVGRRYCADAIAAEDAVQDALVAATDNLASFRGDGSLEGWLVRLVKNACHHMRRGRKNDPAQHLPVDAEALRDDADSPEERAATGELARALGEALLTLPAADQAIVILFDAEGYSARQIGDALAISENAVRTRASRARQRLRVAIGERMPEAKDFL
ncbi:MAG: sigma-70 family RNA polymerase sigma factor [Deltaproteobacteria bacterium]|nr:sigma-70 family RNA polymerase sigma factor [Deltaproteobacteria bacterium]